MIIGVIIFAKIISFIYYDKKLRVKKNSVFICYTIC
mgnify:CR=1 FL=1